MALLAPGATVTFVTTTRFGHHPNRPPNAVDDSLVTAEDTAASLNVLTNDSDPDGDPISFVGATAGSHGTVNCVAGVCTYTPAPDYNGTDSFTYTISDGRGASDVGTVNVTVNPVDEPRQTLTVTRIGNARITSSPAGIDCGDICSAEFEVGTVVTLTATPDPGWTFSGWAGACDGHAGCVVTVDAGKTVTASFALPPPTPGQTVNATPLAGEVLVKVAGTPSVRPALGAEPGSGRLPVRCHEGSSRADRRSRRRDHRHQPLLRRDVPGHPADPDRARRASADPR